MENERQYHVPFLDEIIAWEKKVAEHVSDLETPSGYFLGIQGDGNGFYNCSPIDSIQFARTGMDGIHYSILTDFGCHQSLEEAPVICVSPMDFGEQVRLVARNLRDFFTLVFTGHQFLLLNTFGSKQQYLEALQKEHLEDQTTEYFDHRKWLEQKKFVYQSAIETFQLEPIADPYDYIQELRSERSGRIVLETEDGLGVIPLGAIQTKGRYKPHPWSGEDIPYQQIDELESFLSSAPAETVLSFVRDYQAQYIMHLKSLQIICDKLEQMGFDAEAQRLMNCTHIP